jgi:hypothetical protein
MLVIMEKFIEDVGVSWLCALERWGNFQNLISN